MEDLRARRTPHEISRWLRPLGSAVLPHGVLRLEVPSHFHAQHVQERFGSLIASALVERWPGARLEIIVSREPANGLGGATLHETPVPFRETPAPSPDDILVEAYTSSLSRATRPLFSQPPRPVQLNPKYTFEHFVVGKSNQFAHAAARAVAEHPATAYNPLFIFGGTGLGKTHMMQAIGNHIQRHSPQDTILHYSSAESFMNEMIGAIQSGKTMDFRNKYRRVDVLLIDDVQFLQGKESTQEEFFHTFNALHGAHKQIVLTSDRPPKEIPTLEERLVSRFGWGLVTDLQPPDLETRIAILRKRAADEHLEIEDDVLEFIASNVRSNIRELEGSLTRLLAYASLTGSGINLSAARDVLRDFLKQPERVVTVENIQRVIAEHFNVPEETMKVRKRTSSYVVPRQIAMYFCRELTGLSFSEIGNRFGGRDHTTVLHGYEKIVQARDSDPEMRQILQRLAAKLGA